MSDARNSPEAAPRDVIVRTVREQILTRHLTPGDRLREEELAQRFGVSRVPVREALSQLQSEGFVTLVRYRGATVSATSGSAALELIQVRRGLEVLAAQQAAERCGGDVAEELARVVELGRSATTVRARPELPSLILRFHTLVAEAAGNHQLRLLLGQVLDRVSWIFDQHLDERTDDSWSDHAAIARAILAGSPVQAGYLMAEHIAKDEQLLARLDVREPESGTASDH